MLFRTALYFRLLCLICLCGVVSSEWTAAQQPAAPGGPAVEQPLQNRAEDDGEFQLPHGNRVAYIVFEGPIGLFSEHRFYRKLDQAREAGADIVVIEIDSPGGLVSSSVNLANRLNELDWATTIAYIPREAISGAALMSLGSDHIVMHRFAKIGDVGPIVQGSDSMFRHAPEKIVSYLVQVMRDLAEAHGRPPAIAESMVDKDLPVFRVTHRASGNVRYLSEAEWRELDQQQDWEKGAALRESAKGRFLEMNGERAVEFELANGLVNGRDDLARRLGIREQDFVFLTTDWIDSAALIFNSWPVTALLIIIGLIALYVELMAPGIGVGGLIAGLCCALFFWSRFLGGTSGWLEVVLFVAGLVFIAVEIFILPGFGFAGFTGGCLLFASVVMASQRFAPDDGLATDDLLQTLLVFAGSATASVVAMAVLSRYLGKIPILNRLALQAPEPTSTPATIGFRVMEGDVRIEIGDEGIADSSLRPSGRAKFGEDFVDVVTDGSFVESGQPIRIIKISGARIMVRQID